MIPADAQSVLDFWFGEAPPRSKDELMARVQRWFRGGEKVDAEIRSRFTDLHQRTVRGELDHWASTPKGRLALILVLDQFSRNLHRGTPAAFAQDQKALKLTLEGLEKGDDASFNFEERLFFALPFQHAENLEAQDKGVAYTERQIANATPESRPLMEKALTESRHHRDVIRRFGRFPTRNQWLGRQSTPEEAAYLAHEQKSKDSPV